MRSMKTQDQFWTYVYIVLGLVHKSIGGKTNSSKYTLTYVFMTLVNKILRFNSPL